jgi:hypothetical protein
MAMALVEAGIEPEKLATVLPRSRFLAVEGRLAGEELYEAFTSTHAVARSNARWWFREAPMHGVDRTWVLSKRWGTNTETILDDLLTLAPTDGYGYEAQRDKIT